MHIQFVPVQERKCFHIQVPLAVVSTSQSVEVMYSLHACVGFRQLLNFPSSPKTYIQILRWLQYLNSLINECMSEHSLISL